MSKRLPLLVLSIVFAVAAAAAPAPVGEKETADDPDGLAAGRELTRQLYDGKLDAVYDRMSDDFRKEMTREKLDATRSSIVEQLGTEQEVSSETARVEGDYLVYRRRATFSKRDGTIEVLWALRKDGKVAGLYVRDMSAVPGQH